jgi:predicted nucleic acid-binding protein
MALYNVLVSLVMPDSFPHVVVNDADDDHVIATAVAARAELIVTEDRRHQLLIGQHQGIAIVTAWEVVERAVARIKN